MLLDTPEKPEKCPRYVFLGPGVSRRSSDVSFCEKKKFQGGMVNPVITQPARMAQIDFQPKSLKYLEILIYQCQHPGSGDPWSESSLSANLRVKSLCQALASSLCIKSCHQVLASSLQALASSLGVKSFPQVSSNHGLHVYST